jgi:ribose/xylose/arabinose/galactoside ABC-type transport system permease subunit
VITAVVLGGTSLFGGRAAVAGSVMLQPFQLLLGPHHLPGRRV